MSVITNYMVETAMSLSKGKARVRLYFGSHELMVTRISQTRVGIIEAETVHGGKVQIDESTLIGFAEHGEL